MTEAVERIKSALETLSVPEQAEVAHFLIRSLAQENDNVEAAWDAQLERRLLSVKRGEAIGEPAEQVFARLREKYT